MSTHLKERKEQIQKLLENLASESFNGTPIVVEGRKDVAALRSLGVEGTIISAKGGGKSLLGVVSEVQQVKPEEVILLLDFDRRGKECTKRLKQHFEAARVKPNTVFWGKLIALAGKEIKDVESTVAYMETLKSKTGDS